MSETAPALETRIAEWRGYVRRRQVINAPDVDELEDNLRSRVDELQRAGLDEEEAFLIGVKRLGELDAVSQEFAREHSERLWKRLVLVGADAGASSWRHEAMVALGFAIAAALMIKAPALFGVHFDGPERDQFFYVHNAAALVLPFLAGFFCWKRDLAGTALFAVVAPFAFGVLAMNLAPFVMQGDTQLLAVIHLPMLFWLGVGIAYVGGAWRDPEQRMHFVRFSGEWFIYLVLIALGGGVLMGTTVFVFQAIGLDAEQFLQLWMIPCGVAGAVVIAGWLVEAKQSVVENMAPVLTLLFTPLFTLLLLAFLATMAWTGSAIVADREVLIGFDLLLVLVVGLLLYSISARDPNAPPGLFDGLQLALVVCALIVDAIALWAILARITEFGFTPNRVAALGENLILVVNLAWSAVLYTRFMRGHASFARLERWQTSYLPVYAAWAAVVVAIFPFVFRYR